MKHLILSNEDKDEFEFRVDDNPDDCDPWSKITAKLTNPNLDFDGVNPQFLRKNSSRPVSQIKEASTITLDDDRRCTDDSSSVPLDSPHKACCQESEGLCSVSDRILEQHSRLTDSDDEQKISSPCMQNGSVFFEDFAGDDMVQESSPSTPDFDLEENNGGQDQCQSVGGLEMDAMDTIIIYTDYVTYGDKYFPAALILFSRDSIAMKTSSLEEEYAASSSEWKLDNIIKIDTQWTSLVKVAKVRIQLMTDNAAHVDNANETLGIVEVVEFLVPDWSQHQEQIMSLDVRYIALLSIGINVRSCIGDVVPLEDGECSSDPYIPNFEEPFEEVVYPKGEIDAVSVRKSDVDLLLPDVFINDTIIDFYITYLKNEIPHERRHNFHFFSSFFFRKLADLDKNPSSVSDGKAAFQRVRRWTRKVNIFEKDYIFIPVNYNLHWSLIVLCHPGEVANFNDQNIDEALKVPCILHMDSIRGSHAGLKDLLQSYLLEEWKERQKETSEDVSSKFLNLRFLSLELPQQENCSDCGLFLLHYAELFIDEAPQNFSPFRINEFDHFLKPDWFMPAEASLKRVHIQRLIYELLKSLSHESVSPPRNSVSYSPALPLNKDNDNVIEIVSEKRNPQKSCNGSFSYSEPDQKMEMSRHDTPIYRPPRCIDSMTQLLEQQCQQFDRGASLEPLGFCMSTIREVDGNEHLDHSNSGQTGLGTIDRVGEFQIGCSSEDLFQWNSDFSDEGDPKDTPLSSSSRSCDDSTEEMRILECTGVIQSVTSCQNEKIDQLKEIVDSQEGFASASSDMMETPAQDTQELAEKYGSHDQEDIFLSNLEDRFEASPEALSKTEDEGIASISSVDEKLVVENGKLENNDHEDPFVLNSEDGLEASREELVKTEDEEIAVDKKLVVKDDKIENSDLEGKVEASQEELAKTENDKIVSLSSDNEELVVVNDKNEHDDVVAGAEAWVTNSPPEPQRPAKRLRVSSSPSELEQLV
ncbi:hypothetical protein RND81_06G057300 [Saponaria officinalis]|uniref:Ubiquitin-like protease family profile domain-containing protein n=1 Tax=Saponaria officinalis TaxID=3572 RepID=A0AAW1K6F1_SAPOF